MAAATLPQSGERFTERAGQTGRIGKVGEQPGTGVTDDAASVPGHRDLRTYCGSLHPASAFRDRDMGPSTSLIFPDRKALLYFRLTPWTPLNEGPRVVRAW
ncbi:hypothetical protein Acsp01_89730 [Actinoplanes sp. NBRC 101535]|nr:hypothetical protein Acsp01_89730 [Actinoplanes sp. NBRC 101535]